MTVGRDRDFSPDTSLACAVVPAVNVEPRAVGVVPHLLILHYTGMSSAAKAIQWLACAQSRVSCHYVIDEDGGVTQLVPEALRAWHAGVSSWHGVSDVNSASIGIEIQNPGHDDGYPAFPPRQMEAVALLSRDIITRHRRAPAAVLAHSDIAPGRKIDPGEHFDWAWLYAHGVGHWVCPHPLDTTDLGHGAGSTHPDVGEAQLLLRSYGYGLTQTGILDTATAKVLQAFQRHFRPALIAPRLDRSTMITLQQLVAGLSSV